MLAIILSHVIASLYLQKPKYNKIVTACIWVAYAILSACVMVFQKNVVHGFFYMFFLQAFVFFASTIGSMGEKTFLFLTYANSFCISLGLNLILSAYLGDTVYQTIASMVILVLIHLFLYKVLRQSYRKARVFFTFGWWKINTVLVFFLIQFLHQYAFSINATNVNDVIFDFFTFSITFCLTGILIFNLVRDAAEKNKKTYENIELKSIAYIDELTGLKNRAAYSKFIKKQMVNYRRNICPDFVCAVLDIDGFKGINDTRGHAAGDDILKLVGGAIFKKFEHYKCESFRFGGDEFVLLIADMQIPDIEKLLVELNDEIQSASNVTISHGCSAVDFTASKPFPAAFRAADAVMYSNKHQRQTT